MRKRVKIAVAVLFVAVAGVVLWQVMRQREPRYAGKTLTAWLAEIDLGPNPNRVGQDPQTAIRTIGTNALPFLLNLARANDSALKSRIKALIGKQSLVPWAVHTDKDYHRMACLGFSALGSIGENAVPALMQLLRSTNSDVWFTAADCLGSIGPAAKAAVPVLLQFINDTNRNVRVDTTMNLGRIHMDAALVVPILITNLTKSNAILRTIISTLGDFGSEAMPAVPALRALLGDENEVVAEEAIGALWRIDPEAALKAGPGNYGRSPGSWYLSAKSVPAFLKMLSDPDVNVRRFATNALKLIDPEAAAKAGVK